MRFTMNRHNAVVLILGIQVLAGLREMKIHRQDTTQLCPKNMSNSHLELLVPHPRCRRFYRCSRGVATARACPLGLLFDETTLRCDFPRKVKCHSRRLPRNLRTMIVDSRQFPDMPFKRKTTKNPSTGNIVANFSDGKALMDYIATIVPTTPGSVTTVPTGTPDDHYYVHISSESEGGYSFRHPRSSWSDESKKKSSESSDKSSSSTSTEDWDSAHFSSRHSDYWYPYHRKGSIRKHMNMRPKIRHHWDDKGLPLRRTNKINGRARSPVEEEKLILNNGCPVDPTVHWRIPYVGNCTLFYDCHKEEIVLKQCSYGLHFNAKAQVCDWPEDAKCNMTQANDNIKRTTNVPKNAEQITVNNKDANTLPVRQTDAVNGTTLKSEGGQGHTQARSSSSNDEKVSSSSESSSTRSIYGLYENITETPENAKQIIVNNTDSKGLPVLRQTDAVSGTTHKSQGTKQIYSIEYTSNKTKTPVYSEQIIVNNTDGKGLLPLRRSHAALKSEGGQGPKKAPSSGLNDDDDSNSRESSSSKTITPENTKQIIVNNTDHDGLQLPQTDIVNGTIKKTEDDQGPKQTFRSWSNDEDDFNSIEFTSSKTKTPENDEQITVKNTDAKSLPLRRTDAINGTTLKSDYGQGPTQARSSWSNDDDSISIESSSSINRKFKNKSKTPKNAKQIVVNNIDAKGLQLQKTDAANGTIQKSESGQGPQEIRSSWSKDEDDFNSIESTRSKSEIPENAKKIILNNTGSKGLPLQRTDTILKTETQPKPKDTRSSMSNDEDDSNSFDSSSSKTKTPENAEQIIVNNTNAKGLALRRAHPFLKSEGGHGPKQAPSSWLNDVDDSNSREISSSHEISGYGRSNISTVDKSSQSGSAPASAHTDYWYPYHKTGTIKRNKDLLPKFRHNLADGRFPLRQMMPVNNTQREMDELKKFLASVCPLETAVHWKVPHAGNSTLFHECRNGDIILRRCGNGQHFNAHLQVCGLPVASTGTSQGQHKYHLRKQKSTKNSINATPETANIAELTHLKKIFSKSAAALRDNKKYKGNYNFLRTTKKYNLLHMPIDRVTKKNETVSQTKQRYIKYLFN